MKQLGFEIHAIFSALKGDKIPKEAYEIACDYIICFRSWLILPKKMLVRPNHFAINLHPGPPEYPGSGCINFAIYNGDERFGVTTHLMEEKVDSGAIIDFEFFPVAKSQTLVEVLEMTHKALFSQLCILIQNLATTGPSYINDKLKENKNMKWSGEKRRVKDIEQMCKIYPEMDQEELDRRIRAFHHPNFPLYMELHGEKFHFNQIIK